MRFLRYLYTHKEAWSADEVIEDKGTASRMSDTGYPTLRHTSGSRYNSYYNVELVYVSYSFSFLA